MSQVKVYPLSLLLVIGGCAGPMGQIRSEPPAPPPITSFDGAYRTTIRVANSFGVAQTTSWCESPGQPVVSIANGQFVYAVPHPNIPGEPVLAFPATMAEDGTFYGQVIGGSISGQVQGTRIEGRIDGSACIYAFAGNRV